MKQVRIVNNGSGLPFDTKVMDAQTAERIEHVFRVEMVFDVNEAPKAVLHMWMPTVDVTVDASLVHHCPYCRRAMDESTEQQ